MVEAILFSRIQESPVWTKYVRECGLKFKDYPYGVGHTIICKYLTPTGQNDRIMIQSNVFRPYGLIPIEPQ